MSATMEAKKVESLMQKMGNQNVVRLFHTQPFIDDKWLKGVSRAKLKKYLVVRYPKESDEYLPVWSTDDQWKKIIWWDKDVHEKIKKSIGDYDDRWKRQEKDHKKDVAARTLFMQTNIEQYTTDDWQDAQQKYIVWCADENVTIDKMRIGK